MRIRVLAVAFVLLCLVGCHGQRSAPYSTSAGSLATSSRSGFASARTLVMAAVNVVFPWSICPMVPTFK